MKTTEEIEFNVSKALGLNLDETASIRFDQPGLGRIAVDVEELSGASLIQTRMATEKSQLVIPFQRVEPLVVMYFQLEGRCTFHLPDAIQVPERRHSLCYVPTLRLIQTIAEHTAFEHVSIRFKPEVVASQLLEEGMSDHNWQRLLDAGDQPYTNFRESRAMGSQMQALLHQLLHCPYTGKLGQTYKESLLRVLLIDQLSIFRQNRRTLGLPDTKLTRRDIDTLHELKGYLEQHFLDDLSLDKIAKTFGLNTFKLKYGFKKLFDTSVMRYIDDQKMTYARQMLLDGHEEMLDMADQLGYNHYTNFSAAFKRRFGYSPTQLREHALSLN